MEKKTCFQKLQQIQKILDSELTHVEKLVLIKMSMYDDCYITNKWLSVTLGTTIRTIEKAIAVLKNKKIITVERIVRPGTKIQRRQVTNIDFDYLNVNTTKTQEKTQTELCDGLKKENVLKLQTELCDGLKLGGQDLKNGTTKPTTGISKTLSTYNNLNNKYISKKTIRYIMYTQTQKTQKRSDFSMNKSTNTTKNKRFKKPTVEEVREYCAERGNTIDPEYFCDYYDSVGWVVGKNRPMKDWKAAVRTWERNEKKCGIVRLPTGQARREYTQSWYDKDAEIRRAAVMAATKNDK